MPESRCRPRFGGKQERENSEAAREWVNVVRPRLESAVLPEFAGVTRGAMLGASGRQFWLNCSGQRAQRE